jgi:hypothetical protein
VRICNTIAQYVPGMIILIAGDVNYGPVIRLAHNRDWIWFWTVGKVLIFCNQVIRVLC